jgi:hypothetical protein
VVSIPYDELEENAELVKTFIRLIVAPYLGEDVRKNSEYSRLEREMMRLALRLGRVIRPADAKRELGIDYRTAIKYLRKLSEKGKFRPVPVGRSGRIGRYEYVGTFLDIGLK